MSSPGRGEARGSCGGELPSIYGRGEESSSFVKDVTVGARGRGQSGGTLTRGVVEINGRGFVVRRHESDIDRPIRR
jgi:hypothetical protein